jgi:hypothetical protein
VLIEGVAIHGGVYGNVDQQTPLVASSSDSTEGEFRALRFGASIAYVVDSTVLYVAAQQVINKAILVFSSLYINILLELNC